MIYSKRKNKANKSDGNHIDKASWIDINKCVETGIVDYIDGANLVISKDDIGFMADTISDHIYANFNITKR